MCLVTVFSGVFGLPNISEKTSVFLNDNSPDLRTQTRVTQLLKTTGSLKGIISAHTPRQLRLQSAHQAVVFNYRGCQSYVYTNYRIPVRCTYASSVGFDPFY